MSPTFEFSGGALCLDFANSWGNRLDLSADKLRTYQDLLEWALAGGLLSHADAEALRASAARHPDAAAATLGQAITLREAIYGTCARIAAGDHPAVEDLAHLNRFLAVALPRLRLRRDSACCRWEWEAPPGALDRMLWPVVRGVAELLTSESVARVRECASASCSWLFIDSSRNRSRRWCDMATCGNRAKARRHYHRRRSER